QGYHVITTARRVETLSTLKDMAMIALTLVTSQESTDKAKSQVAALTVGRLEVLFNNA
ncbi:hypothetical protein GE09DRAFT_982239, partial [Coniochaeta sp. 2T2.1]